MQLFNNCLLTGQQPFKILIKTYAGCRVVAMNHGKVIWVTGLSGAGKSTLATGLSAELKRRGEQVILLDGDTLRKILHNKIDNTDQFTLAYRLELAMSYSRLCKALADQGFTVIISTISLFKEVYAWNKKNLPNYFQVYLDVPLSEREKRDPKGIYKRYREGKIINIVGLDQPFDEPVDPDWRPVFKSNITNDLLVKKLIAVLLERDYLKV